MIEVEGLTYRYPGAEVDAVSEVSFTIGEGEIFGFLGPSGAGKTTVQKILNKQLHGAQGEARYGGKPLQAWGRDYFEQIGVSFEQPNLYERLSGEANLKAIGGLFKGPCRDPHELFEALGMGDVRRKIVAEYSKGMKQRLVFLRAIQHQPKMLFLDEPTGGNDPGTTERMIDMIGAEKQRGATILLTTHDMHVADALCDRIAFINEGSIVACDTPRNLKIAHGQTGIEVEYLADDELRTEVLAPDRLEDRARLDQLLAGGGVQTVHSREASLGEIFIKLTGRELL
jgi:fluoroquinolone transport system ATP-binding protein